MTKKERQYKDSAQLSAWALIGILAIMIALVMTDGSHKNVGEAVANPAYGPAHNYALPWLDGTEQHALDTMKAIIPKGKGIIEYADDTHDSIRWGYPESEVTRGVAIESDEYRMWITGEGDTIWE
tara:strand:- start:198 stop:572 length:375 start_codon:yes stop_codon:yes gene_type:complete